MKKMKYIQPQIVMDEMKIDAELLVVSNIINEDSESGNVSVDINPTTMGEGGGDDAASRHSIWGNDDEF